MKKVYIETLGCQMNKSDTERIIGMLSHFDYEKTDDQKNADLLIVNTCSIRQLSADKAYSILGRWGKRKQTHPDIKIGICGCVAQQDKENIFKRAPYIDLVFGTHNIYELPDLIKRIKNNEKVFAIKENDSVKENPEYKISREKSFNAWVPIIEGCNNFCTYCIVPYTRGRERSRDFNTIIKEVQTAVNEGFKEITLLGQNVDSYGKDFKDKNITLSTLLKELNNIPGDFRIRFVTSYPTDITDELILTVKNSDKVCNYFHMPMQSGSTEILKKMNRRYTKEEYSNIVGKIRDIFKDDVVITSDFIAGFPGETEEQFQETLNVIDELQLDYSNTAAYSPRELTVAAKWNDKFIDDQTKQNRLFRLNEKNKQAVINSNKKCLGKIYRVLVEDYNVDNNSCNITLKTRADNNKIVHVSGGNKDLLGTFINVKISDYSNWCLYAEIV